MRMSVEKKHGFFDLHVTQLSTVASPDDEMREPQWRGGGGDSYPKKHRHHSGDFEGGSGTVDSWRQRRADSHPRQA